MLNNIKINNEQKVALAKTYVVLAQKLAKKQKNYDLNLVKDLEKFYQQVALILADQLATITINKAK